MSEVPSLAGLYVHVPFCLSKCPYCDFDSTTALDLLPAWLQALEEECRLRGDSFGRFDSLYLGGGTPSILDDRQLDRLVTALSRSFDIVEGAEITIEVNPDDVSPHRLALYRALGFNRISLGVQSLQEAELRFLGRRHGEKQTLRALEWVRSGGFDRVSFDLIHGFRADDHSTHRALWERTLRKALSFDPDHLSCYMMTIEGDTPFRRLLAEGRLTVPSEGELEELFLFTSEFLESEGFIHYEISNFARSEQSLCRHNVKYWDHSPYLGLGPSAHSYRDGMRCWNVRSVQRYCEALKKGEPPREGSELLSEAQLDLEKLFLGLRTRRGVEASLLLKRPGARHILDQLAASRLVEMRQGRILPTRRGFLLADGLPLLF
ncbi:MAG: radical SAM family heme chaperone HemW [Syntrophobacteraceae bacterium]|jgi:oxygen-independent coproporphyrinogen-3 oxidase|nr:radical SAM family heme chaperone HemW [Syntrophobacteraceae bacterium]